MNRQLFTERMSQPQPRVKEFLDGAVRSALFQIVQTRIESNSFGLIFPYQCPDGRGNAGGDEHAMQRNMAGFQVVWPADVSRLDDEQVTDAQIFDLLEYSYDYIAIPVPGEFHAFYSHHHYRYDRPTGQASFANEINRLLERNGIAFTLKEGQIERLAPTVLQDVLVKRQVSTQDTVLDELLDTARQKFLNRDLVVRREALEKLWDAWERMKSLYDPTNKKKSVEALLDKTVAEPNLRTRVETEAVQLTDIGNSFFIRHTEVTKPQIVESHQVDYLFHRMFAMIRMVLHAHGLAI